MSASRYEESRREDLWSALTFVWKIALLMLALTDLVLFIAEHA